MKSVFLFAPVSLLCSFFLLALPPGIAFELPPSRHDHVLNSGLSSSAVDMISTEEWLPPDLATIREGLRRNQIPHGHEGGAEDKISSFLEGCASFRHANERSQPVIHHESQEKNEENFSFFERRRLNSLPAGFLNPVKKSASYDVAEEERKFPQRPRPSRSLESLLPPSQTVSMRRYSSVVSSTTTSSSTRSPLFPSPADQPSSEGVEDYESSEASNVPSSPLPSPSPFPRGSTPIEVLQSSLTIVESLMAHLRQSHISLRVLIGDYLYQRIPPVRTTEREGKTEEDEAISLCLKSLLSEIQLKRRMLDQVALTLRKSINQLRKDMLSVTRHYRIPTEEVRDLMMKARVMLQHAQLALKENLLFKQEYCTTFPQSSSCSESEPSSTSF